MMSGILRDITIGDCRLILADSMTVLPDLGPVDHILSDPPYEQSLHDAKNKASKHVRHDGGTLGRSLGFAGIDEIREDVVRLCSDLCQGWFIAFCTIEGVGKWADAINVSPMKYKRGCVWVKPDSTPQMNGQGPAQGAECFVTAWCGTGFAKWNAGGKRGIYRHLTNPPDRQGGHPTEKPWRLMRDIILDFTMPGQVILDPFAGGGTTAVAAVLTGRKAICIEVNPDYFDIMRLRVEAATASVRAAGPQLMAEVQEALI